MQGNLAAYALCLSVLLYVCLAYKNGDRVSIMAQTLHNEWKTSLLELPLHQMPRFGEPAKFVYHATLPEPAISKEGSKGKGKVNPDQDIKISFTVSDNKILIPWTKIFDSKTKTSLTKLLVTFSHDQYEIIKADVESTFGREIQNLDPDHPSLTGFEIVYHWKNAEEMDFSMGVFAMFSLTLFISAAFIVMIMCSTDRGQSTLSRGSSSPRRNKRN